jgi:hypothetical protein
MARSKLLQERERHLNVHCLWQTGPMSDLLRFQVMHCVKAVDIDWWTDVHGVVCPGSQTRKSP